MREPREPGSYKHHYIPVFYLKQWAGADGKLCEFRRPYNVVKALRRHPSATGYEARLYSIAGVPPETEHALETRFFRKVDDMAARALRMLIEDGNSNLPVEVRSAWSRFINSLLRRHPEYLAFLKTEVRQNTIAKMAEQGVPYEEWRHEYEPSSLHEFRANIESSPIDLSIAQGLQGMVDSPTVGSVLNRMRWFVVELSSPAHSLLTSDRPVVMSNGIGHESSFLFMPLAPSHVFVAVNSKRIENRIRAIVDQGRFCGFLNNAVVRQARQHAYGTNDAQIRFVENRLTRNPYSKTPQLTWSLL